MAPNQGISPRARATAKSPYDPKALERFPPRVRRARALLAVILLLSFGAVGWLSYRSVAERLRFGMQDQLDAILQANALATRAWLSGKESTARQIMDSPPLTSIGSAVANGKISLETELRALLLPLKQAGTIQDYFLLDTSGTVQHASEASSLGSNLSNHALVRSLRERRQAVSGPIEPLFATSGAVAQRVVLAAARNRGFSLILAFDARPLMDQLESSSWGETGEVYAFDRQGLLLTESRFTSELQNVGLLPKGETESARNLWLVDPEKHPKDFLVAGRFRATPPREDQLTWLIKHAVRGGSGSNVEGYRNYLGREVIGAYEWLDEYDFGMATEVSVSDAFASALVVRKAALFLGALLLVATAGFALLGRWALGLRQQSLATAERLDRLARTLQPLSAVLETDSSAVLLIDENLEIVYANPAAEELFSAKLAGAHLGRVFSALSPELREALIEGQDTVVALGEDGSGETLLVNTRELTIDGRLHTLYVVRSVTQELRRQEIEHWKKLIRVLSHELNNSLAPISSLVSSARKLVDSLPDAKHLDEIFAIISERTHHLLDFLESYRSVARLPRPTRIDVDWARFIGGIAPQLPFELSGELPTRPGYFDPTQMERVLLNLLKNAHEAGGPPGEIRVRIIDDQDGARIEVLDRGAGMSRTVLEQATLPFYSTKRTGTGVGLALSREIVEAHRGRLTLSNREGGGLVVTIWLPARPEHRLSTV